MFSKLLFLLLVFAISSEVFGQNLPRRADLGISLGFIDSNFLDKTSFNGEISRLTVADVVSKGSFDKMGGQKFDIILSLNGRDVPNFGSLLTEFYKIREGDKVEMEVWRFGKKKKLRGVAGGKTKLSSDFYLTEYISFNFNGEPHRMIVHSQTNSRAQPTIVFIPGYSCVTVENDYPLLDSLAKAGVCVIRIEKPGCGDNFGDCFSMGFNHELEIFSAGYKYAKTLPQVDSTKMFLFGHSLGGIIAPLIANESAVKGIIVYGTTMENWTEYLIDMVRGQSLIMGNDPVKTREDLLVLFDLIYQHYYLGKSSKELATNSDFDKLLREEFMFDGENQILGRHEDYWREIQTHSLAEAWANVNCSVLSIYGEFDIHAIDSDSHERIAAVVNRANPERASFKLLESTNHMMLKVESFEEEVRLISNPNYWPAENYRFNNKLTELVIQFIQEND